MKTKGLTLTVRNGLAMSQQTKARPSDVAPTFRWAFFAGDPPADLKVSAAA